MDDDKKRKDRKLILCMSVTAAVGLMNILLRGNFPFIFPYVLCMGFSIPWLYFNYSLCKWENRWHAYWNEANACNGEPSDWRLITGKIGEWAMFIVGLFLAALPSVF